MSTIRGYNDDSVILGHSSTILSFPVLPEIVPEPSVNWRHLPKSPPYTLLAWETCPLMTENPIKDSFDDEMSDMRLPCEPSNPDWLKGVGYAEFEDLDSLFSAPSLSEESLGNRRILVGVAMQMLGIESRVLFL